MMRVLIWATHLQTDILALALHLDRCPDVALMVVAPGLATFRAEPIAQACPIAAPLLDRDDPATLAQARAFGADVMMADNHLPAAVLAPRLVYMWHGLGWKARGRIDLGVFHRQVKRLTGIDPRRPNPAFMALCYGETDRAARIEKYALHPTNCEAIGMTFSDVLLDPPYDKATVSSRFGIDVMNRKTALLSITWHYGGIFAQSGSAGRTLRGLAGEQRVDPSDLAFLEQMAETVGAAGANLLVCLHERKRFDASFRDALEAFAARHDFVELRYKDEHPDNLADLLVADVMVSNLSSFLSYFYVLRRPAVHISPVAPGTRRIERRVMFASRFGIRLWSRPDAAFILDPTDVAGPVVRDAAEATAAVAAALSDPGMGMEPTGRWLERHVTGLDGQTAARFKQAIERLCTNPPNRRRR